VPTAATAVALLLALGLLTIGGALGRAIVL
jgi:hypothetical protein